MRAPLFRQYWLAAEYDIESDGADKQRQYPFETNATLKPDGHKKLVWHAIF